MSAKRRHSIPSAEGRHGRVFVISGPSGGGKTTVVDRLRQRLRGLARSISVTTRSPRPGERRGRDYRFVSLETFQQLRRNGELLEWARVHGAYYGTPKRPVLKTLAQGRDIVLSIDVRGAQQVHRSLKERAVLIFLLPPSMARLRQRLLQRRTETPAAIRRRLAAARREIACASWYDYTVVNDRLSQTVTAVEVILGEHGVVQQRWGARGSSRRRLAAQVARRKEGVSSS